MCVNFLWDTALSKAKYVRLISKWVKMKLNTVILVIIGLHVAIAQNGSGE